MEAEAFSAERPTSRQRRHFAPITFKHQFSAERSLSPEFRRSTLRTRGIQDMVEAELDVKRSYTKQLEAGIATVCAMVDQQWLTITKAIAKYPILTRYTDNWVAKDIIHKSLRNLRTRKPRQSRRNVTPNTHNSGSGSD
ncbi:hypothetical protein BD410DRAFT_805256 [Rickenella mellea]|uniref:Uncharacterized protein n=1 Tax=Rickenella mellea TaxID=50990 RepID=A0A4Y7PY79_9AGAM|nr:hypothetical protein BD410DRAFT_805256 [Rickenella mellea]